MSERECPECKIASATEEQKRRWRESPVAFVTEVMGIELQPWQREFLETLERKS